MQNMEAHSDKKLRVALFGAGKMAKHHAHAIALQTNATLEAVADTVLHPSQVREMLQLDVPVFRSAEELLQRTAPDIVHVCTPPETHAPLASMALSQGAHVYVEKPFALTCREAEEVISLANRMGRKVCAGHQLLYESPTLHSRPILKQLGRPVLVESYFSFRPVRKSRDGRGTIPPMEQLVDILPHPVYLLLQFMMENAAGQEEIPIETVALDVGGNGWVHGLFRRGEVSGNLWVTLEGRPVESFIRVVGTNGCLFADFVRGTVVALPGPGTSGISKALNPYSQARQTVVKTTGALFARVSRKQKSYPGLAELFHAFYGCVRSGIGTPVDHSSILKTVAICEEAHGKLHAAESARERNAEATLTRRESRLAEADLSRGAVLVTGGTGMLGKAVAEELRNRNFRTRVVSRRIPPAADRIPGVEYVAADLGEDIPRNVFDGISVVVHCAAETAGGEEAHARNSIGATRNVITAMAGAGVRNLLHVSSIAVLQSSREWGRPVDETTPLVRDAKQRGPYVWGKAESERLASTSGPELGIRVKVVRPGPLVDYRAFEAPGRLGREVGPYFVYIGSKGSHLDLCDVRTAAEVIRAYAGDFESMPGILNLVEPDAPTRGSLVSRLLEIRPDLKAIGLPSIFLRAASPLLKLLQLLIRPGKKPLDIYSAFAAERYDTTVAGRVIRAAKASPGGMDPGVVTR